MPKRRAEKAEPPRIEVNISRELSAMSREIGKVFGGILAVTDKTLEDHSRDGYKLYQNMLRKDSQLAMCFRKRAGFVLAQDWTVQAPDNPAPEEEKRAEWFQEMFEDIENFEESRRQHFKGIAYGFRPSEIIYKRRSRDGLYGIERFRSRDPERFRFTPESELRLCDSLGSIEGEPMPWYKFVVNTWGSDETPYGEGMLRELYPMWFFKNNAIKTLVRFAEKFGAPYIFGTYPTTMPSHKQAEFLDQLVKMHSNSVGIGPEGSTISVQDPGRSGVMQVFQFIIETYVDRQYAKDILGQTLSTESESGTHALAKFQSLGQQQIVEEDSKWQQAQLNRVIKILHDINFGAAAPGRYPVFRIQYEESKDVATVAKGASVAVNELGLEVGVDFMRDSLGYPAPREDEEILPGRKSGGGGLGGFGGFGGGGGETENENPMEPASALSESARIWMNEALKAVRKAREERYQKV